MSNNADEIKRLLADVDAMVIELNDLRQKIKAREGRMAFLLDQIDGLKKDEGDAQ